MKTSPSSQKFISRLTCLSIALIGCGAPAHADSVYWGAAVTGATNAWLTSSNWYADAAETVSGTTPTISDDVFFNTTPDNTQGGTISVTGTIFANSLNYNTSGTTTIAQSGNRELYLGAGGITLGASAGQFNFGVSTNSLSVRLTADQTWTNNSASLLQVRSLRASDTAAGPVVLTLNPTSAGGVTFNLSVLDSPDSTKSLGLVIDSQGGNVTLGASSSYSGGTTINSGTLFANSAIGAGAVLLGGTTGSAETRLSVSGVSANDITVRAGSSGTAAITFSSSGAHYQGNILLNRTASLGSVSSSTVTGTFSGALSGTGGVVIGRVFAGSSSPTVTLTGTSSYTGKTTIASATVDVLSLNKVVGGSATSSLGAPTTAADGTITMGAVAASTLRYSGTGETTDRVIELAANNTTTLNQNGTGHLNLAGNIVSSGSGSRTLALAGTSAGTAEISGTIQNIGGGFNTSVTKNEVGTWRLSGTANLYSGATTLNAGVLEVAKLADGGLASSIGVSTATSTNVVFAGGTLRYIGSGDSSNRLFQFGAAGGVFDASGSGALAFTGTGALTHTSGNRTITFTGTNKGANSFAANITNPSAAATAIVKDGVGTWAFSGTSGYSGGTTINDGILLANTIVSGSNSALGRGQVTVSAGTLGGTGQIAPNAANGISVASGAFIAPGSSIGTLTVNLQHTTGGVSLVSGAGFKFELGTVNASIGSIAGGSSDLLSISNASASDVAFGGNDIDLLGTASGVGFYKLFDTDLDSTTWTGLSIGGATTGGNLITAGLTASNFGGMFTGNLILADGSAGTSAGDIYLQVLLIPEPTTFAMLLGGVGMLTLFRRRSRLS